MKTPGEKTRGRRARDWERILDEHPEWEEMEPWESLDGDDWKVLLGRHPEYWEHCPAEAHACWDGRDWAGILAEAPSLAKHCDFAGFEGADWDWLLSRRPEAAEWMDFYRFDGGQWADLLSVRPEFADRCAWGRFDPIAWELLLVFQPRFADRCDWGELPAPTQASILALRPELSGHCTARRFSAGRLDAIVGGMGKEARGYELGWAALPDGGGGAEPELPVEQFDAWGRRKGLERAALRDYKKWMAGPDAPKCLSELDGTIVPKVTSTVYVVRVEGGRWSGSGDCWTACPGAPAWTKTFHKSPSVDAAGGAIPGAEPLATRFGPLAERYGKALSAAAWEAVLAEDPGLAARCPGGTLGKAAVARLLAKRPELAAHFGRTPPAVAPEPAPDGFPALEFIRWAKRHDIVRRTLFKWTALLRRIRKTNTVNYVRHKWATFHPFAAEAGLSRSRSAPLGYCFLDLADSRGRQTGWYQGFFRADGRFCDELWNLGEKSDVD